MPTITIPKEMMRKNDELVLIPRKEYEQFLRITESGAGERVTEKDVLRWSREAKQLKKRGKLPLLRSLHDLR